MKSFFFSFVFSCSASVLAYAEVPQSVEETWGNFDAQAEPLEIEVIREETDGGIVVRYVRYVVGTFDGKKTKVAAFYGFPEGAKKLPGMVQVHGGGQFARKAMVKYYASRDMRRLRLIGVERSSTRKRMPILIGPEFPLDSSIRNITMESKPEREPFTITLTLGTVHGCFIVQLPEERSLSWSNKTHAMENVSDCKGTVWVEGLLFSPPLIPGSKLRRRRLEVAVIFTRILPVSPDQRAICRRVRSVTYI